MTIGVLKESSPETRVSILPEHIATFKNGMYLYWWKTGQGHAFAGNEPLQQVQ